MSEGAGYEVTMHFWVEDTEGKLLVQPFVATYLVQPPTWCQDDRVVLEMQLDLLAKLKCLCVMRREIERPQFAQLRGRDDFLVRGMMQQYRTPLNGYTPQTTITFPAARMRSA